MIMIYGFMVPVDSSTVIFAGGMPVDSSTLDLERYEDSVDWDGRREYPESVCAFDVDNKTVA